MKNVVRTFFAAATLAASTSVIAASDGTAGVSSTGTSDITLTLSKLISIAGLDNMTLDFGNSYTASTEFCVGQSGDVRLYDVTLSSAYANASPSGTGSFGNNEFQLWDNDNANADYIGYNVTYVHDTDTVAAGIQGTPVAATISGSPLATSFGDAGENRLGILGCDDTGGTNARIDVTVPSAELVNATSAGSVTFNDTLTVTVQAQ